MQLEILRLLIENRNKKLDEEYKRVLHYNYLQEVYKDINNSNKFLIAYLIIYGNKSKEEASEIVHALNLNSYKPTDAELARVIDILSILPSKKAYRYKDIILRLIAESLKEIKEINELISKEEFGLEELNDFKEDILFEKNKITFLKEQKDKI